MPRHKILMVMKIRNVEDVVSGDKHRADALAIYEAGIDVVPLRPLTISSIPVPGART